MSERLVFVFMNEYNFRVEPGFVVAEKGDHLVFYNLTGFSVTLKFKPPLYTGNLTIAGGGHAGFEVPNNPTELPPGFYSYQAAVALSGDRELQALGGSGPGVIIKP